MATTVILWIDNLFSRAQLQQKIAVRYPDVQATSSGEEAFSILRENSRAVLIVDAENGSLTPQFWKRARPFALQVVLFYPHVRTDIANQAKEAGLNYVYPRSQVFRNPVGTLENVWKQLDKQEG